MDNAGLNRTGSSGINGAIIPSVARTQFYAFSCTSLVVAVLCTAVLLVPFVRRFLSLSSLVFTSFLFLFVVCCAAFQYTTAFFGLPDTTTIAALAAAGNTYCSLSWVQVVTQYTDPSTTPFLNTYCFNAAYIAALLQRGYGFGVTDTSLTFAQSVAGVDAGWALGAMTYEAGLLPWESPDLDPPTPVMLLFTALGVALECVGAGLVALAIVLLFVPCRRPSHELTPLMEQRTV